MHVAMTRAEERLILSGAARLGDSWPQPGPGAAPISWIAPALVPGVAGARPRRADPRPRAACAPCSTARPATCCAWRRRCRWRRASSSPLAFNGGAPATAPAPAPPPVEPAAPAPAPPATLSYSSLTRYAQCPYRFHLERGLGLPEQEPPEHLRDADAARRRPAAPALDLRVRGTLVHELLEGLDLRARRGAAGRRRGARAWPRAHEAELSDADVADLQALVAAFAGSALRERLGAARAVHREHAFAFALGDGPMLTGFVDVVAYEADGAALIVDYKSDRVGDADLDELVEAGYGVQRRIYALAALRAGAPAVEVAHLFLERPAEPAVARYEQADARDARRRAARRRGAAAGRRVPGGRRAAPRAVRHLPGARRAVLLPAGADRPRAVEAVSAGAGLP